MGGGNKSEISKIADLGRKNIGINWNLTSAFDTFIFYIDVIIVSSTLVIAISIAFCTAVGCQTENKKATTYE